MRSSLFDLTRCLMEFESSPAARAWVKLKSPYCCEAVWAQILYLLSESSWCTEPMVNPRADTRSEAFHLPGGGLRRVGRECALFTSLTHSAYNLLAGAKSGACNSSMRRFVNAVASGLTPYPLASGSVQTIPLPEPCEKVPIVATVDLTHPT